jgi:2',3'-cyclic-nucleotide 2'-phosphodiesterase (5'-nucleotidase family)
MTFTPFKIYLAPRLQTFLSKLDFKPSAVVLCGDFLSPSTLSSIDSGRGMVTTLRMVGITHVSIGNHEQDLSLSALRERLEELSAPVSSSPGIQFVDSNMHHNVPVQAEWLRTLTRPFSLIESPCGNVKVALLGFLSDEPGIFRNDTFKSVPIQNVIDSYSERYRELIGGEGKDFEAVPSAARADFVIPMTHESIVRDKELAQHMLSFLDGPGRILGGHEHEPFEIVVTSKRSTAATVGDCLDDETGPGCNVPSRIPNESGASSPWSPADGSYVCILKSGMDANAARVVDLTFDVTNGKPPRLIDIQSDLFVMGDYNPSPIAQQVVDRHTSIIKDLENEVIVDANAVCKRLSSFSCGRVRIEINHHRIDNGDLSVLHVFICQRFKCQNVELFLFSFNASTISSTLINTVSNVVLKKLPRRLLRLLY